MDWFNVWGNPSTWGSISGRPEENNRCHLRFLLTSGLERLGFTTQDVSFTFWPFNVFSDPFFLFPYAPDVFLFFRGHICTRASDHWVCLVVSPSRCILTFSVAFWAIFKWISTPCAYVLRVMDRWYLIVISPTFMTAAAAAVTEHLQRWRPVHNCDPFCICLASFGNELFYVPVNCSPYTSSPKWT